MRGEVFEDANTANNTGVSIDPVTVDLTALTPGGSAVAGVFPGAGQSAYYKVVLSGGKAISIAATLAGVAPTGSIQLFVGAGYVPSPQQYDYQQMEFASTTVNLVIPGGPDQTYYVTAYAQSLPGGQSAYNIQANVVQFSLTSVSPGTVTNGGNQTITFTGGGFTAGTIFNIVSSTGLTYIPVATFLSDSTHADVTFNLTQAVAGIYSAKATNGASATLANAVSVLNPTVISSFDVPTKLKFWFETPEAFRAGFPSEVTLHYQNIGNDDIPAPLLFVGTRNGLSEIAPPCTGCSSTYAQQYSGTFNSGLVLGINQQGPAGVLPAGASGTIPFLATPQAGATNISFGAAAGGSDPIATQLEPTTFDCASVPTGKTAAWH